MKTTAERMVKMRRRQRQRGLVEVRVRVPDTPGARQALADVASRLVIEHQRVVDEAAQILARR
jgi:hypothetical protein